MDGAQRFRDENEILVQPAHRGIDLGQAGDEEKQAEAAPAQAAVAAEAERERVGPMVEDY